jgi:glycosyltransferase involved in cell wall biosynthesis
MVSRMPALSLIIAARNAAAHLGEALASVATDIDCEILLADGGSTDATLDIAVSDPRVRIVSRSDTGIYDGMNRGISQAAGRAVLLLNSDDRLPPGAVQSALAMIDSTPAAEWVSGTALFGSTMDAAVERRHRGPLTPEGAMFGVPAINARMFRRSFLERLGPIRTDLGLASDREFLLRAAQSGAGGAALGQSLYFYRTHAGSRTISGDAAGYARVYSAEQALAQGLCSDPRVDGETRRLANYSAAVTAAKRRLRDMGSGAALPHGAAAVIAGAALFVRWRGRLSGY